jgi:hypothetical protein
MLRWNLDTHPVVSYNQLLKIDGFGGCLRGGSIETGKDMGLGNSGPDGIIGVGGLWNAL